MSCGYAFHNKDPYVTSDISFFIIGSWLIGGIPFGFMAGKAKGVDIREHGSGNIGATNVTRVLGKRLGITCLKMINGVKKRRRQGE